MFNPLGKIDGYNYYINNDSDDEAPQVIDSSDDEQKNLDEVDVFLRGTPEQQRRMLQRLTGDEMSSSEDEFEKAMKRELDEKMVQHEKSWLPMAAGGDCAEASTSKDQPTHAENYDDIYFDSDEDSEDKRVKAKKKKLTNDQLFYDPLADDRDQAWVNKQKLRGSAARKQRDKKPPKQDDDESVLTCPACLTTLCMNCQRHEIYKNQYRAMFVMNCNVQQNEILRYKEPKKKKFKRHRKREAAANQQSTAEDHGFTASEPGEAQGNEIVYHPVKCSTCSTEVAVYDANEVYHFFNVIAGPS